MNFIRSAVHQPVTVAVMVILIILAGVLSLERIPIQLTPNVEDTVIAVQTFWEGASPLEIEQEIVDMQEDKLQGIANLQQMTSRCQQGTGTVRLRFTLGTRKEDALREVSDKLREVPFYPENADEPIIEASDPDTRDFIAWIVFGTTDPVFDIRVLQDFAEDRIKPILERVPGMAQVMVLGGWEREVQIRFDPALLAQRGIPVDRLVSIIQRTNRNVSAGAVAESKADVRLRLVSQYGRVEEVEATVIDESETGKVFVRDVAEVVETYKEPIAFVRSLGQPVIAINAQREVGSNVMQVMAGLRREIDDLNARGGILEAHARKLGLEGDLKLGMVYDQTIYIEDALTLVRRNIWLGGTLAIIVLLLFLRSVRSAGIIAAAIPISVIGAVVAMVAMGRTVNVISLAGMAFAVGLVVDNAIVVLENIYRHIEMGKRPFQAAIDGAREVFGAVLASTLTTVVVFIPILLVEEEAGQLFRDIALAIVAAVILSLIVSVTVIPTTAARLLGRGRRGGDPNRPPEKGKFVSIASGEARGIPARIGRIVYILSGSTLARLWVVALLTIISVLGTYYLMPPSDYLPQGNRNIVFGFLVPPPGYNIDQHGELAKRIEVGIGPFYEAGQLDPESEEYREAIEGLPSVPTFDWFLQAPGDPVVPPPIEDYFLVSWAGTLFHGGVSADPTRVVDLLPLFQHATRPEIAPGVRAYAFQAPLFSVGGWTGSAVNINFAGDDLEKVSDAAQAINLELTGMFGPFSVQSDPSNFNVPAPEMQVIPDPVRLSEVGMTPAQLGVAVQALGDGAIIGEYRTGAQTIDLKLIARGSGGPGALADLSQAPIATPDGRVVPIGSVAHLRRVNASAQINREGRQRAVTLQFTPGAVLPLEEAVDQIDALLERGRADGRIPPDVSTTFTGTASKLEAVRSALLGDGTFVGLIGSTLVLALLVVYLLMCVLFQSFIRPFVIMFSVPLATLGGFAALFAVFIWSIMDPYMPMQNLDVLTMLGFVILIGIVVNNAILIVHQSMNFMRGSEDGSVKPLPPREAIAEGVRTRVRPIFMSMFTSIGGMTPLVIMPGSGSELYRGLGSVVIGGLFVSTIFTLLLVPLLFSLVMDLRPLRRRDESDEAEAKPSAGAAPSGSVPGLVILLAAVLGLSAGGCVNWAPRREDPEIEEMLQRIIERAVASQAETPSVWQPPEKGSDVDAALQDRLKDLEAMGGPDSFEEMRPRLGVDLGGRPQASGPITVQEAVASAVRHNLGLRMARIEPAEAQEGVIAAKAAFDPLAFGSFGLEKTDEPDRVPVIGGFALGVPFRASEYERLRAGVRQDLITGTTVSVETAMERLENDTPGFDFSPDPAYFTRVGLTFSQNLLRGFGPSVNRSGIRLSENEERRAIEKLKADLLDLISRTEEAYWNLLLAKQNLLIQQRLIRQGTEVKGVLEKRQVFDTERAEFTDAVATVEEREAGLLRAQRLVKVASDRLKAILNDPQFPLQGELLLDPVEAATEEPMQVALLQAIRTALQERPEVRAAVLQIDDAATRERVSKNLLLPDLDLSGGLFYTGIDEDIGGSISEIDGSTFVNYLLGVSLEVPIGNRAARAEARKARRQRARSLLAFRQVIQDVILDVKNALRAVQTTYELIEASRAFRLAQTENLRALLVEERAMRALTPEFLNLKFSRQDRLALAQREEVAAIANYNKALARYHRAVGTGLEAKRIELRTESGVEPGDRVRMAE